MKRNLKISTALNPIEKITVAYFHAIYEMDPNVIAILMDLNSCRVAEAIGDVRKAIGLTKQKADELNLER